MEGWGQGRAGHIPRGAVQRPGRRLGWQGTAGERILVAAGDAGELREGLPGRARPLSAHRLVIVVLVGVSVAWIPILQDSNMCMILLTSWSLSSRTLSFPRLFLLCGHSSLRSHYVLCHQKLPHLYCH